MLDQDQIDAAKRLADPLWRIKSGALYRIKPRVPENPEQMRHGVPFNPNQAQLRFLDNPHNRSVILKSRQLGYSTLIDLMMLDHAIFNPQQTCVIIAHTDIAARELMRNRILFAYDNLPEAVRKLAPLKKRAVEQIIFAHNGSSIRVSTSARSDTVNFLHVSEMGKIVARFPERALEVMSGSVQAVPPDGICHIESTAEGAAGQFYDICIEAEHIAQSGRELDVMDYRFVFSGWLDDPVCIHPDPASVTISDTDILMFERMEKESGQEIPLERRAWYVTKRNREFSSNPHIMLREYPTTPEEAFRSSTEGRYYAAALAYAYLQDRVCNLPVVPHLPINAAFDLGASDFTTMWMFQKVGAWTHFIDYQEMAGTGFMPFVKKLEETEHVLGRLLLPHDAMALMKGIESPVSLFAMLRNLKPSWNWEVVPRIPSIQHGIDLVRNEFVTYRFDAEKCKIGLRHLQNYTRKWSAQVQGFLPEPLHDEASHCADAIRQVAQAQAYGIEVENRQGKPKRKNRRRPTGMGV